MTYTRYKEYYLTIGPIFARNMASSYGVSWAQCQLWARRVEREQLAACEKQMLKGTQA